MLGLYPVEKRREPMGVDRPEISNVLLARATADTPVFNQAHKQPIRNKLDIG